jgi:hypothetical protein
MAMGITPGRGPWEYIRSPITSLSQGQFQKGDLVTSGVGRLASLFTSSNNTFALGVATHDSLDSLPRGFAVIAYPSGPGCTAFVDTLVTEARSNLSFGEAGSIVSANGRTSTFSKLATSVWSRVVQIRTADQPLNSSDSRIEVMFIQSSMLLASTSSASLLV